jgi:N-acetylmuramoyl-L-alanine amidase
MDTQWIGATAANYAPGRPRSFKPEAIVIHIMAGSLAGTDAWFNDQRAKVSAHYGIGTGGLLHQYVKETDTAFHAGVVDQPSWGLLRPGVNPNFYTIGVEHEGSGAGPWPWPAAQLAASFSLVSDIARRWNIPTDTSHIIPHHFIRRSKLCPGVAFDLVGYVAGLSQVAAPAPAASAAISVTTVRALTPTAVRQYPTAASSVVRTLAVGDTFIVTGVTQAGQTVADTGPWLDGGAGGYVWAGDTDRPNGF